VSEVAPGILRMQLPIRMPGLGHVNCYAVLDREGAAVIDPGLPGPSTWRALQDRLRQAGLQPRHVHTVFVTHSHPDHFGCAARFARESGAQVVAHHAFCFGPPPAAGPHSEVSASDLTAHAAEDVGEEEAQAEANAESPEDQHAREALAGFTASRTPWGGQRDRPPLLVRLKWRALRFIGGRIVPVISHPVEHGDVLALAGREWFVVHTPGHTGDHVCLHDPESRVFFAGDHVLPTITPHISGLTTSPDPLSSYFYSLDRVAELRDVELVLPAHGHPFDDMKGRAEAIKRHHHERLDMCKTISRELGPATVQQFTHRLFRPRSWGSMAESETYAHLEHLRLAGEAERRVEKDGSFLYVTA
jgi:glyoxylase-like metal-dependent hydrolase (beta-lactamase superfamily II)